jgi:hypothetical protein
VRGGGGILVLIIGLLVLWAAINGAGPCLGGAFACLFGASGTTASRGSNAISNPLTAHATGGATIQNTATAAYNG